MIEQELVRALQEFLAEALKDFGMPTKDGKLRAPKIIDGYLPPKRSGTDEDFPFVVVRADSGTADHNAANVEVTLIVGAYTEETNGYLYCLNVMTRIRNALLSLKNGCLADRFLLVGEFSWKNIEDQPWPQWNLFITTNWMTNAPQFLTSETFDGT